MLLVLLSALSLLTHDLDVDTYLPLVEQQSKFRSGDDRDSRRLQETGCPRRGCNAPADHTNITMSPTQDFDYLLVASSSMTAETRSKWNEAFTLYGQLYGHPTKSRIFAASWDSTEEDLARFKEELDKDAPDYMSGRFIESIRNKNEDFYASGFSKCDDCGALYKYFTAILMVTSDLNTVDIRIAVHEYFHAQQSVSPVLPPNLGEGQAQFQQFLIVTPEDVRPRLIFHTESAWQWYNDYPNTDWLWVTETWCCRPEEEYWCGAQYRPPGYTPLMYYRLFSPLFLYIAKITNTSYADLFRRMFVDPDTRFIGNVDFFPMPNYINGTAKDVPEGSGWKKTLSSYVGIPVIDLYKNFAQYVRSTSKEGLVASLVDRVTQEDVESARSSTWSSLPDTPEHTCTLPPPSAPPSAPPFPPPLPPQLPFTNEGLRTAVDLWTNDKDAALAQYGPIGEWDVSQVTSMYSLFAQKTTFNEDISSWDVSKVTNMTDTFWNARAFDQPIGSWDVSSVTTMDYMFQDAVAFNQPLNDWDVSSVKSMYLMFSNAWAFNQPLDKWDVSNVEKMNFMFRYADSFDQSFATWTPKVGVEIYDMLYLAVSMSECNLKSFADVFEEAPAGYASLTCDPKFIHNFAYIDCVRLMRLYDRVSYFEMFRNCVYSN